MLLTDCVSERFLGMRGFFSHKINRPFRHSGAQKVAEKLLLLTLELLGFATTAPAFYLPRLNLMVDSED
ncbi:MAG TPA: hypothetical protein VGI46_06800 [Candidatus Acidoferrum sp.]